jgi:hypothetical protein
MPLSSSLPRALTPAALTALVALALVAAPRAARAQEETPPAPAASTSSSGGGFAPAPLGGARFGVTGEWVLSVQSYNAGAATPSFFLAKQSGGGTSFSIRPGLDYFLGSAISVGGSVGLGYSGGYTTVGLGARAGFNVVLTDRVTFWPTVGIAGAYTSGNNTSSSTAALEVFAPFLYHAAPHFFLGAGPFVSYLVYGGPSTQYGLDFVIGGWL